MQPDSQTHAPVRAPYGGTCEYWSPLGPPTVNQCVTLCVWCVHCVSDCEQSIAVFQAPETHGQRTYSLVDEKLLHFCAGRPI